jgi:hypothetical protein
MSLQTMEGIQMFQRLGLRDCLPGSAGYDIPANEIEAGMELHLPRLPKGGQDNGYKTIEEFLPDAAQ